MNDYLNARKKLAIAQAKRLLGSYPSTQEAGDIQIISAHIVELFCRYPQDRVDRAVVRLIEESEFIPRIAKIKQTLDEETADLVRQQHRDNRVMLPAPEPPPRLTRKQFEAKYRDENGRYPWQFREKERPDWSKAAASMVRQMPGFDDIPDAPLQDWGKLK